MAHRSREPSRNHAVIARFVPLLCVVVCACNAQPRSQATAAPSPATTTQAASPATATSAAATALPAEAGYVLPGDFAPDTDVGQLERRYGKANVQVGKVPGAEGERVDGVTLFPEDASRRAYLYFEDAQRNTGLSLVRVFDEGSRWRLDNGIGIGTPLSTLLAMNGKPIRFYGLDWDYGGAISDWGGGRLDPDKASVRRGMTLGARADIGERPYPMGDAEFRSDDPEFPDLGGDLVVDEISVSFPGGDDL